MDRTIFGLRFNSNPELLPSDSDLARFLESPAPGPVRRSCNQALDRYSTYGRRLGAFLNHTAGTEQAIWSERKLFIVLAHSQFFKHALRSAVEQYLYQLNALGAIDLKKPEVFLRSAGEEIARLNPKKSDDLAKIQRLKELCSQRTADIAKLRARWKTLGEELINLAGYVRDNLDRVRKECETAIGLLAGLQVQGGKQNELVEDIKTHFKEQLRDAVRQGPVTKEYVGSLQAEAADLSRTLSQQVLSDIFSVTTVFEKVHDHAGRMTEQLGALLGEHAGVPGRDIDADRRQYGKIGTVLMSIMTDFRFEIAGEADVPQETAHERLLYAKRREMMDHVFQMLGR